MPFKSEEQRRYLWANEPEIARDWTDTYGSRIQKNSGGISQLVKSGPGRPGYAGEDWDWSGLDTSASGTSSDRGGFEETQETGKSYEEARERGERDAWQEDALQQHRIQQEDRGEGEKQRKYEAEAKAYQEAEDARIKEEKEKEELSWFEKKRAESAKKSLKKLMVHKMRGSPITFPSVLGHFKGPMSDKDFEEKYGVSYEDFANMDPMHMEAIFGSVKDKVSQAERDDIRRISGGLGSENLHKQSEWEKIFYGDKIPPQPGGGGDDPRENYNTLDQYNQPIKDPEDTTNWWNPSSFASTRFGPIEQVKHDFSGIYADGGRAGYAGGGDVRQRYFLGGIGKIFKKATKKIK